MYNSYDTSIILELGETKECTDNTTISKIEYNTNTIINNRILLPYMEELQGNGTKYSVSIRNIPKSYGTFIVSFEVIDPIYIFVNGKKYDFTVVNNTVELEVLYTDIRTLNNVVILEREETVTLNCISYESDIYEKDDFYYMPYLTIEDFEVSTETDTEEIDYENIANRNISDKKYKISFTENESLENLSSILSFDNYYKITLVEENVCEYLDCVLSDIIQFEESNTVNKLKYIFSCDRRRVR